MSYHCGMLALSGGTGRHYPGLSIIDFPLELANKVAVDDSLTYLISPYQRFFEEDIGKKCQLIVAGAGFNGMESSNQITLDTVWK